MITGFDFVLAAPEIFLLGATCVLLLLDLYLPRGRAGLVHFLALTILVATAVLTFREQQVFVSATAFSGHFLRDGVADLLKLFVYIVTGASLVYARPYLRDRNLLSGEFYLLVLFATLGMMILISAGSLLTVYLGLELLALSSYALVALARDDGTASEAAIKYFVLGALASGMLLYGMSMLYGATGTLMLDELFPALASSVDNDRGLAILGLVFVVVGIAFKFGAAPFHMWIPDVYHGAPTAITLFIGSVPKLAAFGMAYRLLEGGAGAMDEYWSQLLSWLAVASLAIGNLLAIAQTNIKRMLAYSTIGHVGFLFMGLSAATPTGLAAAMFYAISYSLMAAGAFAAISIAATDGSEADEIADYAGLAQRHPWHAFMILLLMASLAGLPPLFGFWAKLAVIRAAIDGGMLWLAISGVVFAVIGAFYYLRVIRTMYFDRPAGDTGISPHPESQARMLFAVNGLAMLALGIFWGPLMAWCTEAVLG